MSPRPALWRRLARRVLSTPGVRLLAPGWPDPGRRIVQSPALESLIARALDASPAPTTVVNAGSGEGLYSPIIRRRAGNALLLEFDAAPPPRSADPRARQCHASMTAIPVRSGSVDLAVCTEVLEHVPDDRTAVAELRRILAPTGFLILSVPTPPAVFDPAHVREGYTLDQLTAIFEEQDLAIVEARYSMHIFFQAVLRHWRPYRVPLGVILGLAWLDRVTRFGRPMDLAVLARPRRGAPPAVRARVLGQFHGNRQDHRGHPEIISLNCSDLGVLGGQPSICRYSKLKS
jgi:SAM-dependent methyltransferase